MKLSEIFNGIIDHFKFLFEHRHRCSWCSSTILISTIIFASVAQYSFSASTTGTATAEILANITISQNTEMDFAKILPPIGGGTVTIPKTSDTVSCMGGGTCSGTPSRGKFDITGSDGTVSVSYTDATLSDGSNTMEVDISSGTINNDTTATISSGTATLNVGGILSVSASQISGVYNTSNAGGSTYTVTINY